MDAINNIYLPDLQNGEVVAFHKDSIMEMDRADIGRWFPGELDLYRASIGRMNRTLDVFAASELSPRATLLDNRRDKAWSAFKAYVKDCMNNDDEPEVEAAAERVMFIVRNAVKDVGNPLHLGFAKESTAIESIVRSLEPVAAEIEQMGATRRLDKLIAANKAFMELQIDRDTEKGEKPSGDMKAARAEATEAYKDVISCINAQILLHKDKDLEPFVKTHNATIGKHKTIVAQRKGRGRNGGKDDSSGKPE